MTQGDPREIAREAYGPSFPAIDRYAELLATDGMTRGLLGPREADRIWDRHILNSAALGGIVPEGVHVADIGSGAGLPGLPLAILRTDLRVSLVEPLRRRCIFLSEVVDELGLADRVEVLRARAEELTDRVHPVVTCRALAPLDRLVRWCLPLTGRRGEIVALKGRSAEDEIARHAVALTKAGVRSELHLVRAHPDAEPATVVRLRRDQS